VIWPVFDADAWLKTIPRPDRSGYISVFMALNIFYGVLHMGGGDPQLCDLVPFMPCPVQLEEPREQLKKSRITPITFSGAGGKLKNNVCHLDLHTSPALPSRGELIHVRSARLDRVDVAKYYFPNSEAWQSLPHAAYTEMNGVRTNKELGTVVIAHQSQVLISIQDADTGAWSDVIDVPYGYSIKERWHCKAP